MNPEELVRVNVQRPISLIVLDAPVLFYDTMHSHLPTLGALRIERSFVEVLDYS